MEGAHLWAEGRRPAEVTAGSANPNPPTPPNPPSSLTVCACSPSSSSRLAGVVGQHGQCLSELCGLLGAPCSPSSVVRLLQYYSGWAQLRDAIIDGWTPLGEEAGRTLGSRLHPSHFNSVSLFQVWWRWWFLMTALYILYSSKSYQPWPWVRHSFYAFLD